MRGRKFAVRISSSLPEEAEGIFNYISLSYDIQYLGVYDVEDSVCIYVHTKNMVSGQNMKKVIEKTGIELNDISVCTEFKGNVKTEFGVKFTRGGYRERKRKSPTQPSTIINNNDNSTNITNNISLILVNPIGNESLDHITPEFLQNLLAEHHGPDVVFRFGTKMYSLQENMNFKTDPKNGFISGRLEQDGAWETQRKSEGFNMLMDNLKDKNEQAVLKHIESLPYDDLLKFERDMGWIHEHKTSGLQEDVPVYQKFIRDGFNLLSANIADKKRRIERDTGKKLRLV